MLQQTMKSPSAVTVILNTSPEYSLFSVIMHQYSVRSFRPINFRRMRCYFLVRTTAQRMILSFRTFIKNVRPNDAYNFEKSSNDKTLTIYIFYQLINLTCRKLEVLSLQILKGTQPQQIHLQHWKQRKLEQNRLNLCSSQAISNMWKYCNFCSWNFTCSCSN